MKGNLKLRLQKISLDSYNFVSQAHRIPIETVLLMSKAYAVTLADNTGIIGYSFATDYNSKNRVS